MGAAVLEMIGDSVTGLCVGRLVGECATGANEGDRVGVVVGL